MKHIKVNSTKNSMELSRERDFPGASPVRNRYAILSSPRSGSTLLSRMLFKTGMAGDPLEYLNPYLLKLERTRTGMNNLTYADFVKDMERRRTSENGMFGMQIHYSHFISAFPGNKLTVPMANFIRGFDKLIWVRRRDRMRQAVSFAIAQKTGAWSSEERKVVNIRNAAEVHPIDCLKALNIVCRNDYDWETLIDTLKLDVHVVWFEDLTQNYHEQSANVVRYLGLDSVVTSIPAPPIQRQSSDLNEQVLDQLYAYLGLPEKQCQT